MREQRGYIFHQGSSWFVRYCDSVLQADGSTKRVQVCKKLNVPYLRPVPQQSGRETLRSGSSRAY